MGAAGRAFTFVTKEQGDELDKVESLINMVIPQGNVEGFEPTPPPSDWTVNKPGSEPSGPGSIQVRMEKASFDAIIGWLSRLSQQNGISVDGASIDTAGAPGVVNAAIMLHSQ